MSGVRASFCVHDDARPATVEIAYVAQNSGPGVSVLACPDCAGQAAERRTVPRRHPHPASHPAPEPGERS